MRLIEMQQCPWCHADLDEGQLFSLDDKSPSECKQCGQLIRNSRVRNVASFILLLISYVLVLVWDLHPAFWLVPLILYPFIRILVAKPLKVQYEEHLCLRCKRLEAGFRSPFDNICDDCLTTAEVERAAKKNER